MATYRITVQAQVKGFAPCYLRTIERKRRDAAHLAFQRAVYEAFDADSIRDRPAAWNAHHAAQRWTPEVHSMTLQAIFYSATIERTA